LLKEQLHKFQDLSYMKSSPTSGTAPPAMKLALKFQQQLHLLQEQLQQHQEHLRQQWERALLQEPLNQQLELNTSHVI
jgi:hypothetical protein